MYKYDNLSMRLVERKDLEFLLELRSDPCIWKELGNIKMNSLESQYYWFDMLQHDKRRDYYILEANGNKVGMVRTDEIDYINRNMRVGGDISKEFWYRHLGTKMMELLKQYCFDYLNMHRIWLMVLETNVKAHRLYTKAGFVEEGRHREAIYRNNRYIDYIIMGMLKKDYKTLDTIEKT